MNLELNAPGLAGLSVNEPFAVELHQHAVNGGAGHAEEALKVHFSGRPSVDQRVGRDEGEVLALEVRPGWLFGLRGR